jgi:hypothetical protein
MQVSESNKQEAEKVITTINAILIYNEGVIVTKHFVNELAIQDRLSVLDLANKTKELLTDGDGHPIVRDFHYNKIKEEITNLTEQIEFLKTKL